MISSIIQALFHPNSAQYEREKKKKKKKEKPPHQKKKKESTICLTPKPSPKNIQKKLEFLYGLHQVQTLTPLITLYGAF